MKEEQPEQDRLPEDAEALLAGWPVPARSALEWEDTASATMARIRAAEDGPASDDLFAAPLPPAPDEKSYDLDLPEDEPRLADIARAALASGAELKKEIAKEGLLAAEQTRAVRTSEPIVRREPRQETPHGSVAGLQGRIGTHAVATAEPRPVSALQAAPARSEHPHTDGKGEGKSNVTWAFFGGAALAFAAAAAFVLVVRSRDAEAPQASVQLSAAASPGAPKAAPPVGLDTLPMAPPAEDLPAARTEEKAAASAKSAGPPKDSLAFKVQPASKSKERLVLEEQEEEPVAGPSPSAAPAPAQATTEAKPAVEQQEGMLPERPSQGAVLAAVGSVMTGARSCLVGQTEGSRATVVFAPDGHVRSVSITGPAAGTPAESCLKASLSGARVPAFTEPSYSAALTVRPP